MSFRLVAVALAFLAACADDDRPPSAELTTELARTAVSTPDGAEDGADGGTREEGHPFCEPGSLRTCTLIWYSVDQPGIKHCRQSTQVCQEDGRGWYACNDLDAGAHAASQ